MNEIEALKKRVAELEKLALSQGEWNTAEARNSRHDDAEVMAIYTIVQELAAHLGVSHKAFLDHYKLRHRIWHDRFLRDVENISPAYAAELDTRSLAEADIPESYPPLFGPPPQDPADSQE